jgi:hypothetical protein
MNWKVGLLTFKSQKVVLNRPKYVDLPQETKRFLNETLAPDLAIYQVNSCVLCVIILLLLQ